MIREAVVENFSDIVHAVQNGADRIELCADMSAGGTTPSYGMVKCAVDYCHSSHVEVAVMIRPRGGSFTYDIFEQEIMRHDVMRYSELGVDYFVTGHLTPEGSLDTQSMQKLMRTTHVPFVMHMAYDQIDRSQQLKAMDQLVELGIARLLTHGSSDSSSDILHNVKQLSRLLLYSRGRLEIMPGGGLHKGNVDDLLTIIPFHEVHGTKII